MSRVVNPNSPGKQRNYHMRSCAELLRHLGQKQSMDNDVYDLLAALFFSLRDIESTIEQTTSAWEKRDYWIKAEKFRQQWMWVGLHADKLESLIKEEAWERIPEFLIGIAPRFAKIKVSKMTRTPTLWQGKYQAFLKKAQ